MTLDLKQPVLTDEQKRLIYGILLVGCDRQTAADYTSCSLADLRSEMQRDPAFAKEVRRREAEAEFKNMQNVAETAREKKEWRASVWWLERRSPERFGRRAAGAVTGRQLKAYLALLADLLCEGVPNKKERQTILDRLNTMSDDVDKILRDDQLLLASLLGDSSDAADAEIAEENADDSADDSTNLLDHWT